jgi:uncharacterized repeat protein (TIGR03803 family)
VYKVTAAGQESVLFSFQVSGGANPFAGVTLDSAGNLYGTTYGGGLHGEGTVYKLSPAGQETVLCSFPTATVPGGDPLVGLILDAAGNMYGAVSWKTVHGLKSVSGESTTLWLLPSV